MINVSNIKFHGLYADDRVGYGYQEEERGLQDRSGVREGVVIAPDGSPVPNILVGLIHMPTRQLVAHAWTDAQGKYRFEGLTPNVEDYMAFPYPDEDVLGDRLDAPTTWMLDNGPDHADLIFPSVPRTPGSLPSVQWPSDWRLGSTTNPPPDGCQ